MKESVEFGDNEVLALIINKEGTEIIAARQNKTQISQESARGPFPHLREVIGGASQLNFLRNLLMD